MMLAGWCCLQLLLDLLHCSCTTTTQSLSGGWVVGWRSYQFSGSLPTQVEVELGCDNSWFTKIHGYTKPSLVVTCDMPFIDIDNVFLQLAIMRCQLLFALLFSFYATVTTLWRLACSWITKMHGYTIISQVVILPCYFFELANLRCQLISLSCSHTKSLHIQKNLNEWIHRLSFIHPVVTLIIAIWY